MTMICKTKNKAELKAKLEAGCWINCPTPWGNQERHSSVIEVGFKEPVVLDPQTRRRFAQVERTAKGWKVT